MQLTEWLKTNELEFKLSQVESPSGEWEYRAWLSSKKSRAVERAVVLPTGRITQEWADVFAAKPQDAIDKFCKVHSGSRNLFMGKVINITSRHIVGGQK